jgi:hypothetical protein
VSPAPQRLAAAMFALAASSSAAAPAPPSPPPPGRPEHTVEMARTFRQGTLAILPATDHIQIVERDDLLMPLIAPFLGHPPPP